MDDQAISLVRREVRCETGITEPQLEFTYSAAPQPPRFRQVEFPWRYRSNRRKPAFEEFKLLRELLGRGNKL